SPAHIVYIVYFKVPYRAFCTQITKASSCETLLSMPALWRYFSLLFSQFSITSLAEMGTPLVIVFFASGLTAVLLAGFVDFAILVFLWYMWRHCFHPTPP